MHIKQTRRNCGQCCLAMLAGVTLPDAVKSVGHNRGTTHSRVLAAAKQLGLTQKTTLWHVRTNEDAFPRKAICKAVKPFSRRRNWHWVCFVDGIYHDPATSGPEMMTTSFLIVSWMEFE